ncbi:forkhead box protein J2 [Cucurbitaria berberidis CBS 394.84]|uniref:Forkhead box protein J2 n=1 Tax=Cucurbitaria berberidis CBS 394.84 TaxID=1168544 RepID=A0A9P4LDV0_9PLEO|nr:forkhead box protein J2 [Cucurbitaria berberidis CBS 394.84]KAF1851198.1 forkhead box protein J2 [Cucurbitaria berberidis CBS 394.84]
MAAARRQPSVQIFQDPVLPHDHHEVNAYDPRYLDSFVSITDVSNDSHTLLAPPEDSTSELSPRKTRHISSSPPPSALAEKGLNAVSLPPPKEQNFSTDALTKKAQLPIPEQAQAMAGEAQYWTSFPSQTDKENACSYSEPVLSALSAAEPPTKQESKRLFADTAPLRDRSKKQKVKEVVKVEEVDGPLPHPEQMPSVEDDGNKPTYSYAMLIGMAILRAPSRRLTLAQIYKWISDTFVFYRNSQETGWQNSIRHNLSLSKSFSKQERPKDDPGKGHYWVINPGFEKQYHKIKPVRRPANPDGFLPAYPGELPRSTTSMSASFPPMSSTKGFDSSKFPEEAELPSSDATIPCSDPTAHDGHDPLSMPPPRQMPSSPPPVDIHSSPPPPVSRPRSAREDTPPRAPRFPTNSRSGGRKRKFNGLGDSGYYSSIESSAIKGNPLGPLLTSEADVDRPNLKRGRAEEEIARIRGSSYDSPSKTRPYMKQPSNAHLISSPFRRADKTDGPLTPAIVFKRPALPPASASPNTNLRNHRNKMRELVGGSPDKSLAMWVDTSFLDNKTWSPAVSIPNEESVNLVGQGFESTFDIFGDFNYNESPIKRSASKRPRLERAATTSGILADITGSKGKMTNSPTPNWKLSSSFLNIPNLSPAKNFSPLKAPMLKPPTSNPVLEFALPNANKENGHSGLTPPKSLSASTTQQQQDDEDIFHLLHSDESEPGIDLLQGFEKIGARTSAVAPNGSPQKVSRPGMTRSSTVRF